MYLTSMTFLSVICFAVQKPTRRLRRQQDSFQTYTSCLHSLSHGQEDPLKYIKSGGCQGSPGTWQLRCRFTRLNRNCHFFVTCTLSGQLPRIQQSHNWVCSSQHLVGNSLYSYCCDPVCPSSTGRK